MKFIKSKGTDGLEVYLFYQDWGTGSPVVFIHGWPSDHQMWEHQTRVLPQMGLRCVAYDRRGFGKSDKPLNGYEYDTFADDLKALLDQLDLQNVTLVGFSMGGGEVARYFSRHGGERVSKVILVSSILPYVLQTDDNPNGVPLEQLEEMIANVQEDRPAFLQTFGKMFYGVNFISKPVSQASLEWSTQICLQASPKATIDCIRAFGETDFRSELKHITVPTLIIHGNSDNIVPIDATSQEAARLIPQANYVVYEDAPHGLFITEKERLTVDILQFVNADVAAASEQAQR